MTLGHDTRPYRHGLLLHTLPASLPVCLYARMHPFCLRATPGSRLSRWVGCDYRPTDMAHAPCPSPLSFFGPDSLFRAMVHYLLGIVPRTLRRQVACVSTSYVPGAVIRSVPEYPSMTVALRRYRLYPSVLYSPVLLSTSPEPGSRQNIKGQQEKGLRTAYLPWGGRGRAGSRVHSGVQASIGHICLDACQEATGGTAQQSESAVTVGSSSSGFAA